MPGRATIAPHNIFRDLARLAADGAAALELEIYWYHKRQFALGRSGGMAFAISWIRWSWTHTERMQRSATAPRRRRPRGRTVVTPQNTRAGYQAHHQRHHVPADGRLLAERGVARPETGSGP